MLLNLFSLSLTSITYAIVRQQLETDNEKLTTENKDMVVKLQCYEKDLKNANECKNHVFQIVTS